MDTQNIELITRLVMESLNKQEQKQGAGYMVPIGVSARHIHLTQADLEVLFGPGYQLTKKKELMGGQFASNEQVPIVGTKLRAIENVRILGPVRKESQVEISMTDARTLGVAPVVRNSGDIAGSAPGNHRECLHRRFSDSAHSDRSAPQPGLPGGDGRLRQRLFQSDHAQGSAH